MSKASSPRHPGTEWVVKASCRDLLFDENGDVDPENITRFFVDAGHVISERDRQMCRTCPVRRECLIHAYYGCDGGPMIAGYFAGFSFGQRSSRSFEELAHVVEQESKAFREQD